MFPPFLFLVCVLVGDKFLYMKISAGWEVPFLHCEATNGFFFEAQRLAQHL